MKSAPLIIMLIVTLTSLLRAVEVPQWVMSGILRTETRSYYEGEQIIYVDRRVGAAGELSAFQITKIAWKQVRRRGESFSTLRSDQRYAEQVATRYLCWLYDNSARGNWERAVEYYNRGPGNRSKQYLTMVKENS